MSQDNCYCTSTLFLIEHNQGRLLFGFVSCPIVYCIVSLSMAGSDNCTFFSGSNKLFLWVGFVFCYQVSALRFIRELEIVRTYVYKDNMKCWS